MAGSIVVRLDERLQAHMERQIGDEGSYEDASDYIGSLIRQDLEGRDRSSEWLRKHLEPAMRADEVEFVEVSAEDVIQRNKSR